jgi:transcriptional regulator with XRE-family HTH domain
MQTFAVFLEFSCPSEKRALCFLIELFRRSKNLTRAQLEELASLPPRSLDRIEQGTRGVEVFELQQIAVALERPLDDFLPKQVKNGQNNVDNKLARSPRKS